MDSIIAGHPIGATTTNPINSIIGLSCAHITDVYGPSGVGKTAFWYEQNFFYPETPYSLPLHSLQTAVLTLQKGHDVIWIGMQYFRPSFQVANIFSDCGTPIPISRLKELLRMHAGPSDDALHKLKLADMASRFHHYSVADLAHLLALFVHPGADFPSDKTALIIIDSISTTFEGAYARIIDDRSKRPSEAAKWAARRKYAVMADLISRLEKVATMNNLAVLLTQQTRLNLKFGIGGLLTPSMFEPEWGNGIWTQLVMFRDFPPNNGTQHSEETTVRLKRLRYLGLIKINGVSAEENGRFGTMVPISIEKVLNSCPTFWYH